MQFCLLRRTVLLFTLFICLCRAGTPIVIAHRGSSGYRPENTIGSYDLGIEMGADFIEGDLVPTKDHVLVASHYPLITNTTDVADRPEFASRLVEKHVSGVNYTGFFIHDFTLAELKSLRARESHSWRDQSWNDVFSIPTLEEVLRFVRAKEKEKGRKIGVYLETKHPAYYRSIGLPLEEQLVDTLNRFGYEQEKSSVFIQSFETNLKIIKNMSDYPLIQLVSGPIPAGVQFDTGRPWPNVTSLEGLKEIATYATGVGPHKTCILQRVKDEEGNFTSELRKTDFMDNARSLGLLVHVWTFQKDMALYNQDEERILFDSIEEELQEFYNLGIDGVFADHPDIAIRIRSKVLWTVPWTQIIAVLIAIALVIAPRFSFLRKTEASPELSPPKVRKISNSHSHTF